jgi:hypothetical protein
MLFDLWRHVKPFRQPQLVASFICYGDVHAGTIAIRIGIPHDEDPWGWNCGFYPGSEPGEQTNGTAATFDQARGAAFLRGSDAAFTKRHPWISWLNCRPQTAPLRPFRF